MLVEQLSLMPDYMRKKEDLTREYFSHGGIFSDSARQDLERRYENILEETDEFNRTLVSFQASKTDTLHSWIKYREGFSSELVEILLHRFGLKPGATVLDPFAGSATTLLVAKMLGIDAVGIELLPHCHLAWDAKSRVFEYNIDELREIREMVREIDIPEIDASFPHLRITRTAFSRQAESDLLSLGEILDSAEISSNAKLLSKLILTSILEEISYTRKDGQYLRWDRRAGKIIERNKKRIASGKKPTKAIHKGELTSVRRAFMNALNKVIVDISELQREPLDLQSKQRLIRGNTLYELPKFESNSIDAVITSPPYANRYDYTRTYALELAYLGVEEEIFDLRQRQLSCTVENRSKLEKIEEFYRSIGELDRYKYILGTVQNNKAFIEINEALNLRNKRGEVNNRGIIRMIEQYFTELTFVFAELYRVCKPGASVAFVNDNVRYAGEVIPVDLLSTNLAESLGFEPVSVLVLPQRKGNSSQQMKKYGRTALRKSITIWKK